MTILTNLHACMHARKVGGYLGSNNTRLCVEWKKELVGSWFGKKWFFQVSRPFGHKSMELLKARRKKPQNDRKVDNLAIVFGAMAQWAVQPSWAIQSK